MNGTRGNIRVALLAGVSAVALAAAAPQPARAQEDDGAGYYAVVEARYGFGAGDDITYRENNAGTLSSEIGPERAFSGRAGFGWAGAGALGRWDFGLFYTGLRSSNDDTVYSASNAFMVIGTYNQSYDNATADTEMSYHVVDLEAGYDVGLGDTAKVRAFGGVRFASFDQQVDTLFTYGGPNTVEEHRTVDYSGAGPRIGVTGAAPVGSGGFGVTGTLAASMVFGTQKTATRTIAGWLGTDITVESKDSRRVTALEAELGVTYELNPGTVFELGYRYESWLGVNNTESLPPTRSGNIYGTDEANQAFHGPYLRASMKF